MLVLVGSVVAGAAVVSAPVVRAGATGAVVVALLGEDGVVVTAGCVVDDGEGDVEPPP
jgi:hypothetical protein